MIECNHRSCSHPTGRKSHKASRDRATQEKANGASTPKQASATDAVGTEDEGEVLSVSPEEDSDSGVEDAVDRDQGVDGSGQKGETRSHGKGKKNDGHEDDMEDDRDQESGGDQGREADNDGEEEMDSNQEEEMNDRDGEGKSRSHQDEEHTKREITEADIQGMTVGEHGYP